MPAHIVASVSIFDAAKFKLYAEAIDGLAQQFGGNYLFRGPVKEVLEGAATIGERIVVLQFPDAQSARAFYNSEQYQHAKTLRAGAAEVTMRLVEA